MKIGNFGRDNSEMIENLQILKCARANCIYDFLGGYRYLFIDQTLHIDQNRSNLSLH